MNPSEDLQKQALVSIESAKNYASRKEQLSWERRVKFSPDDVIAECQKVVVDYQQEREFERREIRCDVAVQSYIKKVQEYHQCSGDYEQRKLLDKGLSKIEEKYLKDDRFISKLESSRNEHAIERMNRERDALNRQNTKSCGLEM